MTINKSMIRDEARRRMALVHGAGLGADMTQKAVNTVILHLVAPSLDTLHRLQCHLAVLTSANELETTLPDDFADDKHWPMPPVPTQLTTELSAIDANLGTVIATGIPRPDTSGLRQELDQVKDDVAALREDYLSHSHEPEPIGDYQPKWSDFVLRKDVEALVASLKG